LLPPKDVKVKVKGVLKRVIDPEVGETFKMGINFIDLDAHTSKEIGFFLFN
jgi:hypothetical protein